VNRRKPRLSFHRKWSHRADVPCRRPAKFGPPRAATDTDTTTPLGLASPCVCVRTLMKQRSRLCDHLALVDTGPCGYFEMVAHTAAAPYSRHAGAGAGASPPEGRTNTQHSTPTPPTTPFLVVASCVRAPKVEKTQTRGAYRHKRTRSINRKWSHTSVERYWKTSTTARPAPRATTRSSPQESEGTHHPPAACARAKMSNSVCDHLTLMHMALIDNPEMVAHLETQS